MPTFLALIGLLVIAALIGLGVKWFISNVTLKQSKQYSYEEYTDSDGNKISKVIEIKDESK